MNGRSANCAGWCWIALGEHDAAVWLSGSCARGDVRHPDDIDVAIFPRGDFPSGFFAKFAADFEECPIPYDLDLVDLREAGPELRDEVLWTGIRWRYLKWTPDLGPLVKV